MRANRSFVVPEARAGDLIITCVGDRPVLPPQYHQEFLPIDLEHLRSRMEREPSGVLRKRLDDGTRIVLVYAADVESLLKLVEDLDVGRDE